MKWEHHPNLRRRPHAPAKGRGRLQVQIRGTWIAAGKPVVSASVFYSWCYARRQIRGEAISRGLRYSVQRFLKTVAEPVGRAETIGRPILWRLRDPAQPGAKKGGLMPMEHLHATIEISAKFLISVFLPTFLCS
jgi:hypothetical protein